MKRLIITASLVGGMLYQTKAQEFTLGLNAAQGGANYQMSNGKTEWRPSFGGEVGLQVPIGSHFKLLSGFEVFRQQSKATLEDNHVYSHNLIDDMGSSFEYRVFTNTYKESHSVTSLRIPLMLQFTTGSLLKTQWYFNAGGKFLLPARISVNASASKITTKGYYPDVHAEVHDLPQHGFGEVNNWQSKGTYTTKSGWLVSAGTGFSFRLSPKGRTRLYAGIYADYGVGNIQANKAHLSLVTYDSKNVSNIEANGTLGMDGVKTLNYVNFGLQLKLGFGHKQKAKKEIAPITAPPAIAQVKSIEKVEVKETAFVDTVEKKSMRDDEKALLETPVYFGKKNNIDLGPESRQYLNKVADLLSKYPESRIIIKGHTCDLGTAAINEQRSKERAIICADYLISRGVTKERIQIMAVSTAEPVAPNDSEENRQRNRRVTMTIKK